MVNLSDEKDALIKKENEGKKDWEYHSQLDG
jgi:hypothetical protein